MSMDRPTAVEPLPSYSQAAPLISVIIPVLNAMQYLPRTLPAVVDAQEHYGRTELILVDNGSSDGSYEFMTREYEGRAHFFRLPGVTISRLRNWGAEAARGEFLSFIDSDCLVPPDYFVGAMRVFQSVATDAAGCEYELPQGARWLESTWHYLHWRPSDGYVPYLWSGNFMVRTNPFRQVGGFDETLTTGEDAELGLRLTTRGFKIYRSRQIPAIHLGNAKTIAQFLRKQAWHSMGMFGSMHLSWLDKVLLMTAADLGFIFASLVLLCAPQIPLSWRLAGLAIALTLAPLQAVVYRWIKMGRVYRPLRSWFLYRLYFAARDYALLKISAKRLFGSTPAGRQKNDG